MIDAELVTRKLSLVLEDLEKLLPLAGKPVAEFLQSQTDELVAERLLERMIGRIIDVNYHLITESGGRPPSDYYESFVLLAAIKVLSNDFARRLAACAGIRNRLAHEYDDIDPVKIHAAAQSAARDFPEYARAVQHFVAGRSGA